MRVQLDVDETARAWLAEEGYDPEMGARPMGRVIQEKLKKPLAELIDTENFVRIGPFKEVMNWAEYAEFLTNWARSSSWDCSYQRLTEAAELVLLELEEYSEIGDFRSVVNTASVYEFSTENKIRYIAVYLQMQLPDPAMLPNFGTAEDTP